MALLDIITGNMANLATSITSKMRAAGGLATDTVVSAEAEEFARKEFSSLTRDDLNQENTVLPLLAAFLALIPKVVRRNAIEGLRRYIRSRKFSRTLFGGALESILRSTAEGALEGADDGIREMMEREKLTQKDAYAILRSRITLFKSQRDSIPPTEDGDTVSDPHHTDPHHAPKGDDKHPKVAPVVAKAEEKPPKMDFLKKLSPQELARFEAMLAPVMEEVDHDPTSRDQLGTAFKIDDGGNTVLEFDPEVIKTHLPAKPADIDEEEFLRRLGGLEYAATRKAFFRTLRRVHAINNRNKPFNMANVRDWIDQLVPLPWLREQLAAFMQGKETGKNERLKGILGYAQKAAIWFLGVHAGIGLWGASTFLVAVIAYGLGVLGLVVLAYIPLPLVYLHLGFGMMTFIGLSIVFGLRLALRPMDDVWTMLRDAVTAPFRLAQSALANSGIGKEPEARVRGNAIDVVKTRSTVVTAVAFALTLVLVVFNYTTYMGAYMWLGFYDLMCIVHTGLLALIAVFITSFGLFGELEVKHGTTALEVVPADASPEYRARFEENRARRLKKTNFGSLAATIVTAVAIGLLVTAGLVQTVGGFSRRALEYKEEYTTQTEAVEQTAQEKARYEACDRYIEKTEAYAANPDTLGRGYCVDFPSDPDCQSCR